MNVLQCTDNDGICISCSKDTWDNHILAEHPEMKGCEAYVKTVIEQPYRIYQDPRYPNRKNYYKPFILPKPYHTQYLRVGVEYKSKIFRGYKGYILTAFPCPSVRMGDILIWEQKI